MKLGAEDTIEDVYVIPEDADVTIEYKGREVSLKKLKTAKRDGKGTKFKSIEKEVKLMLHGEKGQHYEMDMCNGSILKKMLLFAQRVNSNHGSA